MPRTYEEVHRDLRKTRGPASEQICTCGKPAHDWAYGHQSADRELLCPTFLRPYSEVLDDYLALCRRCHLQLDSTRHPLEQKKLANVWRENGRRLGALRAEQWRADPALSQEQHSAAGKARAAALWEHRREDPDFRERHSAGARKNAIKAREALRQRREEDPDHIPRSTAAMHQALRAAAKGRQCDECGMTTNPPGMSRHQAASGHQGITVLKERK